MARTNHIIANCKHGTIAVLLPLLLMLNACSKLVSIDDPLDKVTSNTAFSKDIFANAAVNGIYNTMLSANSFSSGNATLYGALSADELNVFDLSYTQLIPLNANHLALLNTDGSRTAITDNLWLSAYAAIYTANAVIEGLATSTSSDLHEATKQKLTAEAKCLRAFCYFYLVNFFGDVPLPLTTNYSATITAARSSKEAVYKQIIQDLTAARDNLPADYADQQNNRVRVNKWAATALLARVYLFTGDYNNAAEQATAVINQSSLYTLEPNLNNVFLIDSHEAIWQLNQKTSAISSNATPDAQIFKPTNLFSDSTISINFSLAPQLTNAFETGDLRRKLWIDGKLVYQTTITAYYCTKYKIDLLNQTIGGTPLEYTAVLRLAELYLIRAEAQANGAGEGPAGAIADLNIIRNRAGLANLPNNLAGTALLDAVAREWQTEFFCEWGYRWFNLKRTGKASSTLSQIPIKQPWSGDHQLLYPIPPGDIQRDINLTQNPGY